MSIEQGQPTPNMQEFEAFLLEHPSVVPLLKAAPAQIQQFFPDAQFSPEIVTDPELPDDTQLIIYVYVSDELTPLEALDKLKQFNRAWGFEAVRQSKGRFSVSVRYR